MIISRFLSWLRFVMVGFGIQDNDLERGLLAPIPEAEDETVDLPEKRDYTCILNRRVTAVAGATILGLIGGWNIALGVDLSLFRSPDNPNLKPAITAHEITISRGFYLASGVFLTAASILTFSTAFFDRIPDSLRQAAITTLCLGTTLEALPLVFLF